MTDNEKKLLKEFAAYVEKEKELKFWLKQRELSMQTPNWVTK